MIYHSDREMNRFAGSGMLSQFKSIFENTLNNQKYTKKFSLFSAHDTTVTNLLEILDINDKVQPPYASTVFIELYEGPIVKVIYNDKQMKLKWCASVECTYTEFMVALNDGIISNAT